MNDVILSLLAKRPEDRPANAAAVHDALSTVLVDQIVTPTGGSILEAAQLGNADSVAGRFLTKAWQLWQHVEAHSTATREEARVLIEQTRAEAEELVQRTRTEADHLLGVARTEAQQVITEARESAAKAVAYAEAANEQRMRAARERAATMVTASAQETAAAAEEAERLRAEAMAEAERLQAAALDNADRLMDRARQDTEEYRARTVELQAEARRLHAEAERLHADARLRGEYRFERAGTAAEELIKVKAQIPSSHGDGIAGTARPLTEDNWASTHVGFDRINRELEDLRRVGIGQAGQGAMRAPSVPVSFELVRRGYDRAQVDAGIEKLLADQNSSLTRIRALGEEIEAGVGLMSETQAKSLGLTRDQVRQLLDDSYAGAERMVHGREGAAPRPSRPRQSDTASPYGFMLVRRGYDRAQVDEAVAMLVADRVSLLARVSLLEGILDRLRAARAS